MGGYRINAFVERLIRDPSLIVGKTFVLKFKASSFVPEPCDQSFVCNWVYVYSPILISTGMLA